MIFTNLVSLQTDDSPQILVRVELVGGLVKYLPPIGTSPVYFVTGDL